LCTNQDIKQWGSPLSRLQCDFYQKQNNCSRTTVDATINTSVEEQADKTTSGGCGLWPDYTRGLLSNHAATFA